MFTVNDKEQLAKKGISQARVEEQLRIFSSGFPYLRLSAAAAVGSGILSIPAEEEQKYLDLWQDYLAAGHKVLKFVPASGAASRMFKDLFAFLDAPYDNPATGFEQKFVDNLEHFAFFSPLDALCREKTGQGIAGLRSAGRAKDIVRLLLTPEGLNYGALPKGLLLFHSYPEGPRTPLEEHLVEGALYASSCGKCCLHFTVSPEHRPLFEQLVAEKKARYEAEFGVTYEISFSEQKSSTDTIAVDLQNRPFRQKDGSLLFRPAGHGALIENLNEAVADGVDVVFIKNIDNVVPDRLKPSTVRYKQLLAGVLVDLQQQAFRYLELLESGTYTPEQVREIIQFVQKRLFCKNPETKHLEDADLVLYLKAKLHRPIRVCGMVRNVGEPGGGPFLAYNPDGTVSLQILESSQIDMQDPEAKAMFEQGTHFNPVDLVCAVRDHHGSPYDLPAYVDPNTGFISQKSKEGRELKALELPGLWNGAMSDWSTVFVEVPLDTFNPVKTVNDLLREQHQ